MKLLTNASNGTGTAQDMFVGGKTEKLILRTIYCSGTFNGATAKVEISPDNVTWFDATNISFTVKGALNMEARFRHIRGSVSGGAGSESITLELV